MSPVRINLAIAILLSAASFSACQHRPAPQAARAASTSAAAPTAIAPFQWRTLDAKAVAPWTPPAYRMSLLAGHFIKGSPDEQALELGAAGSRLIKVDLTTAAVGFKLRDPLPEVFVWDYNADGVDDLCVPPLSAQIGGLPLMKRYPTKGLAIFGMSGQQLGQVACDADSGFAVGHFSGPGVDELAILPVLSIQPFEAPVYGTNGKPVDRFHLQGRELGLTVADVNGDGTDELIRCSTAPGAGRNVDRQVFSYGLKEPRTFLTTWPEPQPDAPRFGANLSGGQGQDIVGQRRLWNSAKHQLMALMDLPSNAMAAPSILPTVQLPAMSGTLLGLDLITDAAASAKTTLQFYDPDGRHVHTEVLGPDLRSLITLHSGGQAYLVVQLGDKIMIYP